MTDFDETGDIAFETGYCMFFGGYASGDGDGARVMRGDYVEVLA